MPANPIDSDTRGAAIAGFALAFGLITKLGAKGLLSEAEINDLYVLSSLEQFGTANDPAVQVARLLIDTLAEIAATGGKSPKF